MSLMDYMFDKDKCYPYELVEEREVKKIIEPNIDKIKTSSGSPIELTEFEMYVYISICELSGQYHTFTSYMLYRKVMQKLLSIDDDFNSVLLEPIQSCENLIVKTFKRFMSLWVNVDAFIVEKGKQYDSVGEEALVTGAMLTIRKKLNDGTEKEVVILGVTQVASEDIGKVYIY